jgi:hypothetical protein
MKKIYSLAPGIRDVSNTFKRFPGTAIGNGIIRAKLYFPDPARGYYRGVRFDWSGNMPQLEYNGHQYFGKWFGEYHPEIHDVIMGPVEEFMSPDYSEKNPGESFLKPGVGILMKPDDEPYDFHRFYPMLNQGKWTVKSHSGRVHFTHELNDEIWAYQYSKTVRLVEDRPELVIEHTYKNTGKRAIETGAYDHNFFMLDNQPIGPGYTVTFPFNLKGDGIGIGELAELRGNKIEYLRYLKTGEEVFCEHLEGFGKGAEDYVIKIENDKSGTGVRITCDQPFLKLNFWCCPTTICPEPYITIKAAPGEEFKWKIRYEFYELKK